MYEVFFFIRWHSFLVAVTKEIKASSVPSLRTVFLFSSPCNKQTKKSANETRLTHNIEPTTGIYSVSAHNPKTPTCHTPLIQPPPATTQPNVDAK